MPNVEKHNFLNYMYQYKTMILMMTKKNNLRKPVRYNKFQLLKITFKPHKIS